MNEFQFLPHGECLRCWFNLRFFFRTPKYLAFWQTTFAKGPVNWQHSGRICECISIWNKISEWMNSNFGHIVNVWDADLIYVFFSGHQSIWGHRPSRSWQWWPFDGPQKAVRRSRGLGRGFWWSNQEAFAKTTSTSSEFGCGVSKIRMIKLDINSKILE